MRSYSGQGYTINYPSAWATVEDGVQKSGYTESKWQQASGDDVLYELVDDTPGFSGGAEAGAETVRSQVSNAGDYGQLAWGPRTVNGVSAWYWQFTADGVEQADTFFNTCGTGYAVLESAPIGEWSSYQSLFDSITRSFSPSC
jgi:hypothetical protein